MHMHAGAMQSRLMLNLSTRYIGKLAVQDAKGCATSDSQRWQGACHMETGQVTHEERTVAWHLELEMTDNVPTIPYIRHNSLFFFLDLMRLTTTHQQDGSRVQ